jgi:hypothetical protein
MPTGPTGVHAADVDRRPYRLGLRLGLGLRFGSCLGLRFYDRDRLRQYHAG